MKMRNSGNIRIVVMTGDLMGLLDALRLAGTAIFHPEPLDELTLAFYFRFIDQKKVLHILNRRGERIISMQKTGWILLIERLSVRPVLVLGILLFTCLALFLPTRILFIQVEGSSQVPTAQILEAAEQSGVCFGALREEIRSEKVKNKLLSRLPQLEWIGVNTKGCIATISVRERNHDADKAKEPSISSIVASRSGVIQKMTVVRGTPVCKVGQAVEKGELLVSGYDESGSSIYATESEAEIFADTKRNIYVQTPSECLSARYTDAPDRKISLIFGKKRINFYKGSGIYDMGCDKIYAEYYLILPGGWQLPVGLAVEITTPRVLMKHALDDARAIALLDIYSEQYLRSQMIAGEIKDRHAEFYSDSGLFRLEGTFICTELIGQTRFEENVEQYGENH